MVKHTQLIMALSLLLAGLVSNQAWSVEIVAKADRVIAYEGESIRLTFDIEGSADGRPDFKPLEKDFEILSRNKSSSMQIINTKITNKKQWILTVMPMRKGKIRVPPIAFGKDRSNELYIQVKATPTSGKRIISEDIFLEVEVDPKKAYVQSQLLYTVRIYVGIRVSNASLSEPELSHADVVIQKLGDDKRFDTMHKGRRYHVIERHYAIFPQQSGKLNIKPVMFNGQIVSNGSNFMNQFSQYGQSRRLQSRAVEIDVLPIPKSQLNKSWLPATDLQLKESWTENPPQFKVGEAITRTLTLTAKGLTAAQLPEIFNGKADGFKTYPDQPQLEDESQSTGITGQRVEKIAMVASRAGSMTLPAIKINWWNTKTNKAEVLQLPARTFNVKPATGSAANQTPPPSVSIDSHQQVASETADQNNRQITTGPNQRMWQWITLALLLGWISTTFVLWRKINKTPSIKINDQEDNKLKQQSLRQIEKQLKQACDDNNMAASKQALLQWARITNPGHNYHSLTDIGTAFGSELDIAVSKLNQALYSQTKQDWQGAELWQAWQQAKSHGTTKQSKDEAQLAPLHL